MHAQDLMESWGIVGVQKPVAILSMSISLQGFVVKLQNRRMNEKTHLRLLSSVYGLKFLTNYISHGQSSLTFPPHFIILIIAFMALNSLRRAE